MLRFRDKKVCLKVKRYHRLTKHYFLCKSDIYSQFGLLKKSWRSFSQFFDEFLLKKEDIAMHFPCMFFILEKHRAEDPAKLVGNPAPVCATP